MKPFFTPVPPRLQEILEKRRVGPEDLNSGSFVRRNIRGEAHAFYLETLLALRVKAQRAFATRQG